MIPLAFFEMISRWHSCWGISDLCFGHVFTLSSLTVRRFLTETNPQNFHLHWELCRSKLGKASRVPAPWWKNELKMFCCSDESVVYISLGSLGTVQKKKIPLIFTVFDTRISICMVAIFFHVCCICFFPENGSFENCAWTTFAVRQGLRHYANGRDQAPR